MNYVNGILKAVRFWPLKYRQEVFDRVGKILLNITNNTPLDIFHCWITSFHTAIKTCDYRVFEPLLKIILKNPFEAKTSNIQGRYITLHCIVIKVHGYHARHIAETLCTEILQFNPTDLRQVC